MASLGRSTSSAGPIACKWLEEESARGPRFDLIFLDPPTFSNSKRMQGVLDVQRDHAVMIRHALQLLRPAGRLVFSTNYSRFKLDAAALGEFDDRGHQRAHHPQGLRAPCAHPSLLRRAAPRSRALMLKFLTRRLLLSLITLGILSVVVFLGGQLLPGDVGRAVLGPLADARAVAVFNHQVGVDRPLLDSVLGLDHAFRRRRHGPILHLSRAGGAVHRRALANSLKLGALAFVLVVPLGIAGGVWAALRAGRLSDRGMVLLGQSLGIVPEFISSIVLILIFGVWLRWLPMSADWPEGRRPLTQIRYLILPVAAAGAGLLRLYRAGGARRHHRGARCGLHPHRDSQGIVHGER